MEEAQSKVKKANRDKNVAFNIVRVLCECAGKANIHSIVNVKAVLLLLYI